VVYRQPDENLSDGQAQVVGNIILIRDFSFGPWNQGKKKLRM